MNILCNSIIIGYFIHSNFMKMVWLRYFSAGCSKCKVTCVYKRFPSNGFDNMIFIGLCSRESVRTLHDELCPTLHNVLQFLFNSVVTRHQGPCVTHPAWAPSPSLCTLAALPCPETATNESCSMGTHACAHQALKLISQESAATTSASAGMRYETEAQSEGHTQHESQ